MKIWNLGSSVKVAADGNKWGEDAISLQESQHALWFWTEFVSSRHQDSTKSIPTDEAM